MAASKGMIGRSNGKKKGQSAQMQSVADFTAR